MARNVLFLLGVGSIAWAVLCLFAGSFLPDWMGLAGPHHGELYIESVAYNVGMWSALGIFGFLGAMFQRLRLSSALAFLVSSGGLAGGRILAIARGAELEVYTVIALGLEIAMLIMATTAYVSEKARLSREARELKKAEKAALEAALAAEHGSAEEARGAGAPAASASSAQSP